MQPTAVPFRFPWRSPYKDSLAWSTFTTHVIYDLAQLDQTVSTHDRWLEDAFAAAYLGTQPPEPVPYHRIPGQSPEVRLGPQLTIQDGVTGIPIDLSSTGFLQAFRDLKAMQDAVAAHHRRSP